MPAGRLFAPPFPRVFLQSRAHPSLVALLFRVPSRRRPRRALSSSALPAWVSSLFAASPARSYFREGSQPFATSVLRLSRPLDGFLRARARRLVSSRSHVQGSLFEGFSLHAATLPRREELAPWPLVQRALTDRNRLPCPPILDFEASIRVKARVVGPVIHLAAARSLLQVPLLQVLSFLAVSPGLPVASTRDVAVPALRLRARRARPSPAFAPRGNRLVRLRTADLLEFSSLPPKNPNFRDCSRNFDIPR
jgi:hypothetical protein